MGVARSKLASTSRCAAHSLPSPSLARQRGKCTGARVRMILYTADLGGACHLAYRAPQHSRLQSAACLVFHEPFKQNHVSSSPGPSH